MRSQGIPVLGSGGAGLPVPDWGAGAHCHLFDSAQKGKESGAPLARKVQGCKSRSWPPSSPSAGLALYPHSFLQPAAAHPYMFPAQLGQLELLGQLSALSGVAAGLGVRGEALPAGAEGPKGLSSSGETVLSVRTGRGWPGETPAGAISRGQGKLSKAEWEGCMPRAMAGKRWPPEKGVGTAPPRAGSGAHGPLLTPTRAPCGFCQGWLGAVKAVASHVVL